ncbi:diacylglycerol kinase [Methyloceanibacter sp. wino2]|uniref:diacylglycerol kinase n=1 Tax=Methyloceanibacter sp. wino2 TaxID=2170729 RepID=UPI001FE1A322|nr:diacylglycerol kinase [Methyloceanibacter sp. wino2]
MMDAIPPREGAASRPVHGQAALPGKGGLIRIGRAFRNTMGGFREGLATEAAIKQEVALGVLALPVSIFIADNLWVWAVLMGSIALMLAMEFLNTAIERLCNHVHPERHEAIKVTKDLASAGVFCVIAITAMVWIVAIVDRFFL